MSETLKTTVFSFERIEQACAYIRMTSPLHACNSSIDFAWGLKYQLNRFMRRRIIYTDYIDFSDFIVVQRTFPQKRTITALKKILASGRPVIYDTDDLLFDFPKEHILYSAFEKYIPYIVDFMSKVDAVTVSTEKLADRAKEYNKNVYILPNLIDDSLWSNTSAKKTGKIVIGFSGTLTHTFDIAMIEDALLAISEKYRNKITFTFLGSVSERLATLPNTKFIGFQPTYSQYAKSLMAESIDIAVVPLEDTSFNCCKSNIKWLEYSACGIPGVYSDLLPYNSCILDMKTGVLAGNTSDSWFNALDTLVSNEVLRKKIGTAAQHDVLTNYSLKNRSHIYSDCYHNILNNSTKKKKTETLAVRIRQLFKSSPFKH